MNKEKWIKWEPLPDLEAKYNIDSVSDNDKGFKIILSGTKHNKKRVEVHFPFSPNFYKSTNETFWLKSFDNLNKLQKDISYGDWTFFIVENSLSLLWLSDQSYGISNERDLHHFSFIAMDVILEVINSDEPTVKFID